MLAYLIAPDGDWVWCIDPATLQPDPAVLSHEINDEFGGILGAFCMQSDVLDLVPDEEWLGLTGSRRPLTVYGNFPGGRKCTSKMASGSNSTGS